MVAAEMAVEVAVAAAEVVAAERAVEVAVEMAEVAVAEMAVEPAAKDWEAEERAAAERVVGRMAGWTGAAKDWEAEEKAHSQCSRR